MGMLTSCTFEEEPVTTHVFKVDAQIDWGTLRCISMSDGRYVIVEIKNHGAKPYHHGDMIAINSDNGNHHDNLITSVDRRRICIYNVPSETLKSRVDETNRLLKNASEDMKKASENIERTRQ